MGDQQATDRFVWPPRPAAPVVVAPPAAVPVPARSRWRTILGEIERVWLGRTTPPLAERIEEAGWSPEIPEAACPRCATSVGPHEADVDGCPACRARRLPWERAIRLGDYDGLLRELVLEIKFTRWRRLGDQVGAMLGARVAAELEREGVADAVLVPVPMAMRRRFITGIDHALVLTRGVARVMGLPIVRALERKYRPSQRGLGSTGRSANVAGSIRPCRAFPDLSGRLVIVVDDVRTTGATLSAACRALRTAPDPPERVWTAVVGVTPSAGRRGRLVDSGGSSGEE